MTTDNWCPNPGDAPELDPCEPKGLVSTSSLCEHGWQPLLLTGFLRDTLARQWSDPQNILAPELKQFIWSEDDTSGILIESVTRFRADSLEKRPAIMIKRNSYRPLSLGIGNKIHGVGENAYATQKGAHTRYLLQFIGTHTLFCIGGSGASTEILATEVLNNFVEFAIPLQRHLNLKTFTVSEVGALHKLDEAKENFVVPITLSWCYEHTWELRHESLPLQSISLTSILGDDGPAITTGYTGP